MRAFSGIVAISAALVAGLASAGGPLAVRGDGESFLWSTASAIQYRTDDGPLSDSVTESQARTRVQNMFAAWQDVPSSSIRYNRAGFITGVSGDVNTAGEFNTVEGSCGTGQQSPIVFDADGAIFIALGVDETSVIGFAGPCAVDGGAGLIVSGIAVMNGLFQDGQANPTPDLTTAEFNAAFIHEFGHFSGLDHSQVNVECLFSCGAADLAGLPTMFPFLVTSQQGSLSTDDVAWISKFYPQPSGGSSFAATHGTITGTVLYSDGESHVQVANVVARRVDTGDNQDRRIAASAVSGYRFRLCTPNPITNPGNCDTFGVTDPGMIGFYEIPVPAGTYTIEVEALSPEFIEGSGVGPLAVQRPLPGIAPAPIGPITVTAGQTTAGHDVVLIGTPPRFDQFEGP